MRHRKADSSTRAKRLGGRVGGEKKISEGERQTVRHISLYCFPRLIDAKCVATGSIFYHRTPILSLCRSVVSLVIITTSKHLHIIYLKVFVTLFLPRDACSAKRGICYADVVCLSVCNVEIPSSYRGYYLENNYTDSHNNCNLVQGEHPIIFN